MTRVPPGCFYLTSTGVPTRSSSEPIATLGPTRDPGVNRSFNPSSRQVTFSARQIYCDNCAPRTNWPHRLHHETTGVLACMNRHLLRFCFQPGLNPLSLPKIQSDMRRQLSSRWHCCFLPRRIRFCLYRFTFGSPWKHAPATSTRNICLRSGYCGLHPFQPITLMLLSDIGGAIRQPAGEK